MCGQSRPLSSSKYRCAGRVDAFAAGHHADLGALDLAGRFAAELPRAFRDQVEAVDVGFGEVAAGGVAGQLPAQSDPAVGLFTFLQVYPLPLITSLVAILLIFVFFVAGADAATIVLGRMSAGGVLNPGRVIRLVWGAVMAAIAAVLLLTGGLEALERASILAGLPFALIMIAMCWSLYKGLSQDAREEEQQEEQESEDHTAAEHTGQPATNPGE